jgi:outer membrane protein TolC
MNLTLNRNQGGKYPVSLKDWLLVILLASSLFSLPGPGHAEEIVKVKSIDYLSTPGNTSIAVGLSSVGRVVHYRLSKPERIIVDLKSASLAEDVNKDIPIKEKDNPVKRIRASQYRSDTVRIVCDLEKKDLDYKVSLLKKPLRLGISIFKEQGQQGDEKEKGSARGLLLAEKTAGDASYGTSLSDGNRSADKAIMPRDVIKSEGQMKADSGKADNKIAPYIKGSPDDERGLSTGISRENLSGKIADSPPSFTSMDFSEYVKKVLDSNPSVKIDEEDYRQTQVRFLRDLETYGFQLSLDGGAQAGTGIQGTGANIRLDLTKHLYDGGKQQILENEFEVVKALSRAKLLESYDTTILTAVLYYSEFYYKQEVVDFLREQFDRQKDFIDRVGKSYQKGIRFSSYDYLTSRSDHLNLEKTLVNQKADFTKTEIAFRQFGHVYNEGPVKVAPLDVALVTDMDRLQKYALVHNKSIYAARLGTEVQEYKISERRAEGGLKVDGGAFLGAQVGDNHYTGGDNLLAGISLNFSFPLYDSGVRKSEIFAEQIGYLKQRLAVQKTEEDVIKRINDVYTDYRTMESRLKILDEQLALNEKRLRISIERLQKGLDDYRAVRESWDDLISTKIEAITQRTLEQKLLVDLSILSGLNLFH